MDTAEKFEAVEIAYQLPNRRAGYALGPVKTCIVRSQAAMDKKFADLAEKDAVIYGTRVAS